MALLRGGPAVGMVGVPVWAFRARLGSTELVAVGAPPALVVMPQLFLSLAYTYAVAERAERWRVAATSGGTRRSGR